MKTNTHQENKTCPCQSNSQSDEHNHALYSKCCQPIHQDITKATTAEALMRSRYSACALLNETFMLNSWHPETCPPGLSLEPKVSWIGLEIKATTAGGGDDDNGEVEYVARCKSNGRASRIHEISRFTRHNGHWVYLDGKLK